MTNLLQDTWGNLDPIELRLVLSDRLGPLGQYSDRTKNPDLFYLPLAGASCRLVLRFKGSDITAVEPGPAFDQAEWNVISEEIDRTVHSTTWKVGRAYSLSTYRVEGVWRGERSGVQILPPPEHAPRAPFEMAEHPFILEFPLRMSPVATVNGHRRLREHQHLTLLLNVLLAGRTSVPPRQSRHFWAACQIDGEPQIMYVQEYFSAKLGSGVVDQLSQVSAHPLSELDPQSYSRLGHDGLPLRAPADLDDSLHRYFTLAPQQRSKVDRATFWIDVASRQWHKSVSASFGALVSAIEALTERSPAHDFECPKCGQQTRHETPGPTRLFRDFFETYAPGASLKKRRDTMYQLRSGIFHGSTLMRLDLDRGFGWDPPWWDEQELLGELSALTRISLRNWLRNPT